MSKKTKQKIDWSALAFVRCESVISTADWCTANIYLSPRIPTPRPGQWRQENAAAICRPRGPLDALDDPTVEQVVIAKGSQTGFTLMLYCWLAKVSATDPSSAMLVMNSTQDAREKASESWLPLWEDSPSLRRLMPTNRRRHWTKLYQSINETKAQVYWVGANSPGRLASKPIRRLLLDEVDKYPEKFGGDTKREAGAVALAVQRTKAFQDAGIAKIIMGSTPTLDTGEIWVAYQQGDQRKLYVRCHACGEALVMEWRHFKVDMQLAQTDAQAAIDGAHFECPHCAATWTDEQRFAAIDVGEWRATAKPQSPSVVSFHFPSWCSKFRKVADLAELWIKSQTGGKTALQNFINSECGEPFYHYEEKLRDDRFSAWEGAYDEGKVFVEVDPYRAQYSQETRHAVICGVDVQKGYLVAVFRAFVSNGDSGLVWSGTVNSLSRLTELAIELKAFGVFLDQRYRTREIQEWCFLHRGCVPVQGVLTRARSEWSINRIDLDEGKTSRNAGRRTIDVIGFDADRIKDVLYSLINGDGNDKRYKWLLPKGYATNREYTKQMSAEASINGRWRNPGNKPNHFWDAEVIALLGAKVLGLFGEIASAASAAADDAARPQQRQRKASYD